MLNKLKEWTGYIVAALTAIIGVLVYMISRREDLLDSANPRNELHEADKQSAVINTEVAQLESDKKSTTKEIDKADTKVVDLQAEKESALAKEKDRKPDHVEDYWNK